MTIDLNDYMPGDAQRIAARDTSNDRTGFGIDRPNQGDAAECRGSSRTAEQAGIFKTDTQVSYNGVSPWHSDRTGKQTNIVAGTTRSRPQFILDTGVTWEPKKVAVKTIVPDGSELKEVTLDDSYAIQRSDTGAIISHRKLVGEHAPVQSFDYTVSVLDDLVAAGATYETGGSLFGGRKVWAQVRLQYEQEIVSGDWVSVFVMVSNAYDGTQALRVTLSSIRATCNNTKRICEREGESLISIRHTRNANVRVDEARNEMLARVQKIVDAEFGKYRKLADVKLTDEQATKFLCDLIPCEVFPEGHELTQGEKNAQTRAQNIRDAIKLQAETGKGVDIPGVMGSGWGWENAVTAYVDHVQGAKRDPDSAFENRNWGTGANLKDEAFDLLLKYLPAGAQA
jgi:phage/plasmid-like protein (TIGR03299 family)